MVGLPSPHPPIRERFLHINTCSATFWQLLVLFEQLFAFTLSNSSSYLLILGYRSTFQCLNRPFFHISRCLVDNLWISCQTKNKKWAKSYPLRSWAQDKSVRPTRSAVFTENSKCGRRLTLNWLECLGPWVHVKKVIQQFYWLSWFLLRKKLFSNAGHAAKLHKNA